MVYEDGVSIISWSLCPTEYAYRIVKTLLIEEVIMLIVGKTTTFTIEKSITFMTDEAITFMIKEVITIYDWRYNDSSWLKKAITFLI